MNDFFDLTIEQLENLCIGQGKSTDHAHHIYRAAYAKGIRKPWDENPVPKNFRAYMEGQFSAEKSRIKEASVSTYDGSVKFLIELHDGAEIESVLMPESTRMTICLSSQVGCRQACVFCSTGQMGLLRNLTAGEIVAQVMLAKDWVKRNPDWHRSLYDSRKIELTNIVFMGMGEPLDNVMAVNRSISIFTERKGLSFSKKRISVSTAGHLEGLQQLLSVHPTVSVAFSLHSPDNLRRSQLMPINKKWGLDQVISAIDEIAPQKTQGVLIQYTLMGGVNDSFADAELLAEKLKGKKVKVNLIPFNSVEHSRFRAPDFEDVQKFRDVLHTAGLRTMVRYSKGQDIAAACGQLVKKKQLFN